MLLEIVPHSKEDIKQENELHGILERALHRRHEGKAWDEDGCAAGS